MVCTGAVMSVSIHPGAIAFTWMLCGASSIAMDLVNCTIAPFAALYEGTIADPKYEYMLPMLIIFPLFCLSIDAAASLESRKAALRWVSMMLSQSSGFSFSTPPLTETLPALLTRMPMAPSSLATLFSAGSNWRAGSDRRSRQGKEHRWLLIQQA